MNLSRDNNVSWYLLGSSKLTFKKKDNTMITKNKLKASVSIPETTFTAYGININKKWDAENKLDGVSEQAKQASSILADDLVAIGAKQIDLIAEPKKEKPIRDKVVNALIDSMAENKQALLELKDKKELHKRASKEMLNWCSPSYIALQFAQIEKSEQRNFIRKADVKNFLTSRINTAVDDLKAMLAYRLGEGKLSAKDAKEGIDPTKRADKVAIVKKDRVDTTPKTDKEKIHCQINNAITIAQNTRDDSFSKVEVLVLLQQIVNLIK